MFSSLEIILLIGASNGFILAGTLLFLKRPNQDANRILAFLLLIFSISILIHSLSDYIKIPNHSAVISILFSLLGPLLFLYVKSLTLQSPAFNKTNAIHFLPFIICLIITVPFYIASITSGKPHILFEITAALVVIQITFYIILSIKALIMHAKRVRDNFSSIHKINLNWLRFLIIGFTVIWVSALFLDLVRLFPRDWDFEWLVISLFLYLIGYAGLRQPEIFSNLKYLQDIEGNIAKKKYEKTALTPELADKYFNKLITYVTCEKPYLNNNLTLPELSEQLSIPVHLLSQVINEQINKNFNEFINFYRIEEAKRLILDPGHANMNLTAICFESGFNSISSFNSAFKKYVKITPSQYKNTSNNKKPIVN